MYSLLVRVPHRIDDLHKLVEEHIKSHGGESLLRSAGQILRSADQQPDDHRTFVMVILDIYDRSTKLINGAFKDNIGFSVAMDKVCLYLSVSLFFISHFGWPVTRMCSLEFVCGRLLVIWSTRMPLRFRARILPKYRNSWLDTVIKFSRKGRCLLYKMKD